MTPPEDENPFNIPVRTKRITRRLRRGYPAVLAEALFDFSAILFDDDDLEPALELMFDFARERGYQLQGTNEEILASLRALPR